MRLSKILFSAIVTAGTVPMSAHAQQPGFFAGLDTSIGTAYGSSGTKNGGAAFAGGGIVDNVKFGNTAGIGGHVGYQFSPALSAFISYHHTRGDVSWDANFPAFDAGSEFSGTATSNAILANIGYDLSLTDATAMRVTAGAGVTFNSFSSVVETDKATSLFLSDVEDHTQASPIAQIGLGIRHEITSNAVLGLNASVAYTGGYRTGDTRSGNLGVTGITPYKIDDVWRTSLSASVQIRF